MAKATKSAAGRNGGQATKAAAKSNGRSTSSSTRTASSSARSNGSSRSTASRSAGASKSAASRANGSSKGGQRFDEATLLHELFVEELRDIYWAEKHLTKALPKMAKAATSEELRGAFQNHLSQTEEQIGRVEQVFQLLGLPARAKKCEAMEGLVQEAQQGIEDTPKGSSVRDAALIICAQKVEHYEIAAYGSLAQLAKTMGQNEVADLLVQTLEEEKETDQLLTELAVSGINITAEQESE
ncbi:ferritin-like domain-containing protein [Flaviaesturariibacter aridisoli]|uniref:Ferritin-like domain-containing protein n=1 Tax=Flaviaesturariibacter aridisoli TaxID=2545761 RepID=A0A4R4DXN4_9BACT|nr:ferritin-like domain-containing protein [Flaviaesturariibacter aridisoli]TCZ69596.1 ferritin-like domain-containing protein [Flaviaesturariibacter aridisoli]